ncbi:MAG: thrombospondin type 3 repeat-containing protein, partial [Bacteroidota bacterium]
TEVYFDVNTSSYQASYFPKTSCTNDTDGDGILNQLDLDSDGDGCSDALEAGATTNTAPGYTFPGPYGANGLANNLETSSESGVLNYNSSYDPYAISNTLATCLDTDIDGISDIDDIDDDNDGVLDVVESPACYYAAADWNTTDKTLYAQISSELTTVPGNSNFSGLTDNATIDAVQFTTAPAQSQLNKTLFKVTFPRPVQLDALYIRKASATQISGGNVMLQGSNDNSTWTNLFTAAANPVNATNVTANGTVTLANSNKFTVATNAAAYRYYRIYGVAAANVLAGIATEVYFDVNTSSYQASYFPKTTCTNDTDGDGILNQLDLDSDGDGCSDAKEAGATTSTTANYIFPGPYGANGLANSLETSSESGLVNYNSTYSSYALNDEEDACVDSDGDGINDVVDLDDDNDGVPDTVERSCGQVVTNAGTNGGVKAEATAPPGWVLSVSTPDIADASGHVYGPWNVGCTGIAPLPPNGHLSWMSFFSTTQEAFKTTLNNLVPNNTYSLEVHYGKFAALGVGLGQVSIKLGTTVIDQYTPTVGCGWETRTITFTATASSQELQFQNTGPTSTNFNANISISANAISPVCSDLDTDNDGIPNHLDTDSDGDGCSDAFEAGATTNTNPGYTFPGPYGANGLDNSVETSTESGTVNYFSTYDDAVDNTTANCTDTDVDGIADGDDIDDDNDGIVDAVESPSCFFTAAEWNTTNKSSEVAITSGLNTLAPNTNFAALADNNGTTAAVQFVTATAQNQLNKELIKLEFDQPIQLDALYIKKTTVTQIFGGNVMLQASNDGLAWVNLLTAAVNPANATNTTAQGEVSLTNSNKFTVQQQPGNYLFYRIYGVASANVLAGIASEIYFDVYAPEYTASYYPKPSCSVDTDGDGIANHLDPDSDGDGCSDALEAGATANTTANYAFPGPYGANGLVNSLETTTESGVVNYASSYSDALNSTIAECQVTDTDGDGESDQEELANGTDPNDPCSYTNAPVAGDPAFAAWSMLDCDGDGDGNGTDPDPTDPCVFAAGSTPDPTNAVWAAADCDEDGETNGEENTNGTDPNDPCSYTTAPVAGDPAFAAWSVLDCDGDGDGNGTDPDPTDPCVFAAGSTPDPTNAVWAAADCDGDGVTNLDEVTSNGGSDPVTDPNDPCNYNEAEQVNVTPAWSALDCDGDGDSNGSEVDPDGDGSVNGVDPAPLDPCVFSPGSIPNPANAIWAAADCDVDGEINGEENGNGTDYLNPCSYTTAPVAGDPEFVAWSMLDCDGDGEDNGTDTDPLDPCVYAAGSVADPTNALWAAADCDEDGETNGEENTNGTDPEDPCSYTNAPVAGDPAYAAWSVLDCDGDGDGNGTDPDPTDPCVFAAGSTPDPTNSVWAAADCDEDGETNGEESTNGTDPNDPCSYTNAPVAGDPEFAAWSVLDCDGDGDGNGTDPDPADPCVYAAGSTPDPTNAVWAAADCDEDGETNGEENTNGTDPNDPCSYTTAPVAGDPAFAAWSVLDCDGDGDDNGTDPDPADPCVFAAGSTPDPTNAVWAAADCDEDGETNGEESNNGTDPTDPCSYASAPVAGDPAYAAWSMLDCDGDGDDNGTDPDPTDPCVYAAGSTPDPTNAVWAAADCDEDGETNGEEDMNGTDPTDPCSYTNPPTAGTLAYAVWGWLDCDGDGTPNGLDTDPLDPCVFVAGSTPDPANTIWSSADCDNDGETNGFETNNGTDPTNPCDYTNAPTASSPAYAVWSQLDCDGDGTDNGIDTDPLDPCVPGTGTPDPTNAIWAAADCDNDGETNGFETNNGTDPTNPCDYTNAPTASSPAYAVWSQLDCDGDGTDNGIDTDPLDPCVPGTG